MLYYDKELYREAINKIDHFCLDILDDLSDFSVKNDYDKEWVFEFKPAYTRGDAD